MTDDPKTPILNTDSWRPNWQEMSEMVEYNEEQEQELNQNRWKMRVPIIVAVSRPIHLVSLLMHLVL